jgi:hypothetical protein
VEGVARKPLPPRRAEQSPRRRGALSVVAVDRV